METGSKHTASNMSENGKIEFTFIWQIKNYSHYWGQKGSTLLSPSFSVDILENTDWAVWLSPRSSFADSYNQDVEYISLYLERQDDSDGPEEIQINFELSLLDKNGFPLHSIEINQDECGFCRYSSCGQTDFVKRNEVVIERKADYIPHDTLTVCCRMWKLQEGIRRAGRCFAKTQIGIETVLLAIEAAFLKRLEYDKALTYDIQSSSKNTSIAKLRLHGTDGLCCDEKIIAEIIRCDTEMVKVISCSLFFIDIKGKRTKCGQSDFGDNLHNESDWKFPLFTTKAMIMEDLSPQALDRIMTLECELTFSNRLEIYKIERTDHGTPLPSIKSSKEDSMQCPSVLEELKTLYDDKILCDINLKTKSETFPAHKMVLCARSPVFAAMLTSDMKEKITDCVEVDDMEDDAVRHFLLYLYTGTLQSLEWETAAKLYYAADKYQVDSLKDICSSFLMDNLSVHNAIDILLLADLYQNADLKAAVQSFIHGHHAEIFSSGEWRNFAKSNSQLAMETMLSMYNQTKVI